MNVFIKRVYAGLLDIMVVTAVLYFMYAFSIYYSLKLGEFKLDAEFFKAEYTVMYALLMLVYFIICELFEQSLGKRAFGLKTVYGKKVKTSKLLRPFLKVIIVTVPYLTPLILLSIFSKKNLLIYDYILGNDIENVKYNRGDLR